MFVYLYRVPMGKIIANCKTAYCSQARKIIYKFDLYCAH
jgi:hypothetical protein